jgi:murein DD-endopeptidase MepM/ murein hydrolase activator NlpD
MEGRFRRRGAVALVITLALLSVLSIVAAPAQAGGEGGLSAAPAVPKAATVPVPVTTGLQVFPVRGPHEYWDGMGAGRGHQGVDVGARCGTPLVAVQEGRVRYSKYHPRAGNYVVIDLKASTIDLAYMHLREPSIVLPGQSVAAGQPLGQVGDTGNASGCHLHFEVWEGAFYGGGAPVDPMPFLESWEPPHKRPARRS